MNKTALYVRVSTDAQAEKGYSIEAQLDKLRAYCSLNEIADYEEYIDAGFSGGTLSRPAIERLISDIESGNVETVIVYKLDRLSRRTKDVLYLVEDIFNKNNVRFISLTESVDTKSSTGKFFISIMSSVAQLERENIKERTMMGAAKRAEKGIKARTPKVLIGYDYDPDTHIFVPNSDAEQIKLIFNLYCDGEGIAAIARTLNNQGLTHVYGAWNIRHIQHILDNPSYTGKLCFRGEYLDGTNIPAIITDEIFEKAQSLRKVTKARHYRTDSPYLLTSLIRCGHCGSRVRGLTSGYNAYYVCYSRSNNHPHMHYPENCESKYNRCNEVEDALSKALHNIAKSEKAFEAVKRDVAPLQTEVRLLKTELSKIDRKISKIYDLYIDEKLDKAELDKRLADLQKRKKEIEARIVELNSPIKASKISYEDIKEQIEKWESNSLPDKRKFLKQIIDTIYIFNDHLEIVYKF